MTDDNSLPSAMLEVMDGLRVQKEAAQGYKSELVEDGWNEATAEHVAAELLIDMNRAIFRGVNR